MINLLGVFAQKKAANAVRKQASPVQAGMPVNSERQCHIQPQEGAAEQQGTPEVGFSIAISVYRALKAYTFQRPVPNSGIHRAMPSPTKLYYVMVQTLETLYRKGYCLYISNNDVSKTMVKIPGGFLK